MSDDNANLLPCPFCGSADIQHNDGHAVNDCSCRVCHAIGPDWIIDKGDAVARWNTRALSRSHAGQEPVARGVTLSGRMLRDALAFVNPDEGDAEQLETEIAIEWMHERASLDPEDGILPAGYYAYLSEYPEEGCYGPLGEIPRTAPQPIEIGADDAEFERLLKALIWRKPVGKDFMKSPEAEALRAHYLQSRAAPKSDVSMSKDCASFLQRCLEREIASTNAQDALAGTVSIGHLGVLNMYLKSVQSALSQHKQGDTP